MTTIADCEFMLMKLRVARGILSDLRRNAAPWAAGMFRDSVDRDRQRARQITKVDKDIAQ
jgi:hypothetical protein